MPMLGSRDQSGSSALGSLFSIQMDGLRDAE